MPTQIQLRRGTSLQNAGFTGQAGEPTVNTDNWSIHLHDGVNQGGNELLRADLSNLLSGTTADLELASITTTGNVDVGGNLTVTGTTTFNGGTLTLGDADTDNVIFGADVQSSILPDADDTYTLGSATKQWADIRATNATIGSIVGDVTGDLTGNVTSTGANTFGTITTTSTGDIGGNFSVATNKFTVDATTGDSAILGDTDLTGDLRVATNQFTVNSSNGDVGAAGTVTATAFSGPLTGDVTGNVTGALTGNADTATALATARNIAGVSFNGTANIALSTDNITEATNLYYTDARVNTFLGGGTATTLTTTGNVTVGGDLTVSGTTTTLNTATLDVEDINITVANGSTDSTTSDGAGLTIDLGTDGTATMVWSDAGQRIEFDKDVYMNAAATVNGNLAVNGTTNFGGNTSVNGHHLPSTDAAADGSTGFDLGSPSLQWRHLYVSGSSVYLAGRRMRIDNTGVITVNTNSDGDYPEDSDQTIASNETVLATSAALAIALGSI